MESPGQGKCQGPGSGSGEKPSKAAECLSELNRIIEAQHELLERQRSRITELELQVTELRGRNARVHEEYQRHLRTCTLQQHHTDHHSISTSTLSALTSIQEKPEYCGLSRTVRRMVYMVFKEGTEELNVVFKFSVDGFDYNIFVSSDADIKCFKCGRTGHLVRACPERQSDPGVSERPGQEAAVPAVVVPSAATVRPAAESPGVAAAPEQTESEPQAQPAAQKPTGATTTQEELCAAEPVTVKSCSAELVSVRHRVTDRDQEKPCLTEPDLGRPCSVDSGGVLELPALAETGTEVQSCRLEAPVTTPVQEDGGDVEMEDEPTFKVPTKRKKKVIGQDMLEVLRDSMNVGQLPLSCRRAILTLLPKKGDLTHLKNWCPVSLLYTDIKLLSKALASRLTKVMEQITHQDQSYCVPDRRRNKGCGSLHWLLEEPLIHGGRLDISGVTAPALSRALISSRVVTLRELVNIAGTDLLEAEDLAARLGLRLLKPTLQKKDLFPSWTSLPNLDGSEGPLLESRGVREMDFGSVSGKLLYRACVKVLNKKLSGRVDTPWRSVLGFNGDIKPEWTHSPPPAVPRGVKSVKLLEVLQKDAENKKTSCCSFSQESSSSGALTRTEEFQSVDTLHQYCCPAPSYNKQLAMPALLKECSSNRDKALTEEHCNEISTGC
ncbi:hypothetical protein QTP70_029367 [Hemibagrus guttatus]|uniref:CCHC-type domain-containing protein n=1 Tax=Hemibagrus guttatus TaxID=175788 RepID=A0AAE0UVL3_9TELE|nr:hypothetical protein QTP70_029367 [Hemibagrus guttatus]